MKSPSSRSKTRPKVVVVGLGPAGGAMVPDAVRRALHQAASVVVRTARHPAVETLEVAYRSFDSLYDEAKDYDVLYAAMVGALVEGAFDAQASGGYLAYAVPGSPYLAERSVVLLRAEPRLEIDVIPAPSFVDLVWDRLGVDPLVAGVRLVDAADFAARAAGDPGPLLVAHCHSRSVLSALKLAVEDPGDATVTVLHHLGLPDEVLRTVSWHELDHVLEPDHLTSVWIPRLAAPVAAELVRLEELVRVLRERCPWDRRQTHGSLGRHLLEEAYEALDAIEAYAALEPDVPAPQVAHLEEELGDLLFQVMLHSVLGAEEGAFTLADVARSVHDKLVARHPHVFGDAVAHTPEEVAARWELLKKAEKGRSSVTEGIPDALPALALAAKLQRKAESVGLPGPGAADRRAQAAAGLDRLATDSAGHSGETLEATPDEAEAVGEVLFALADLARQVGVDPETALRAYALRFRRHLEASE